MPFFILILILQVCCIVHMMRTGANRMWLTALLFLPLASSVAYLIIEVVPRAGGNRHLRFAKQKIVEKIDPERELRAAQDALELTDTMANRVRVADALTALGRHAEALPFYQRGAGARPDFRTGEKLARCLFLNDRASDALSVLDKLPSVIGQSDQDLVALLRARVLEDLGRHDDALQLYSEISPRMAGDEARCRYAALLLKLGRTGEARRVLEEVAQRAQYIDRYVRLADAPMYDWAEKELTALRA
jgi:hypothetical protein